MMVCNTMITVLAILLASLVMAQYETCTRYGANVDVLGASCADIYNKNPTSQGRSGYYVLKIDHRAFFAYCDMELECGGHKGGWMRIADLDTSRGDICPSGWTSYNSYCRGGQAAGCYSANYSTNYTKYSKVCGKVKGYQKGTMDGFFPSAYSHGIAKHYKPKTTSRSLEGVYVDGISITSGNRPRKHVWTYAVGLSDDYNYTGVNCPCAKHPGPNPPSYVGSHYYCESGNTGSQRKFSKLYTDDPLWDGAGCLPENSCCHNIGMPWFFRQFPTTTTGHIEVRICHDQGFADEGVAIEQLQLYVQ